MTLITSRLEPPFLVVTVEGELDVASAPKLAEVMPTNDSRVVVDLTDATFIGSVGITGLLNCQHGLSANGGDLRVVLGEHRAIRLAFEVLDLGKRLPLYDTLGEALAE